jgi:hypothetical protein
MGANVEARFVRFKIAHAVEVLPCPTILHSIHTPLSVKKSR